MMTDKLRAAAEAALETLEWHLERGAWGADIEGITAALRAALAEQQDAEPVAWQYVWPNGDCFTTTTEAAVLKFRHSWSYAEEEREAFDAGVAAAEAALKEKNNHDTR